MKKHLLRLLALTVLITCALSFTACDTRPATDLDRAERNLTEEGYSVFRPGPDSAGVGREEILEAHDDQDNEIYILLCKKSSTAQIFFDIFKQRMDQERESLESQITLWEYLLENYTDDVNKEKLEERLELAGKELEKMDDMVVGRSGKLVWYGTQKAINDSK